MATVRGWRNGQAEAWCREHVPTDWHERATPVTRIARSS